MRKLISTKKIAGLLAVASAAVGLGLSPVMTQSKEAQADPSGSYVSFGDSLPANPLAIQVVAAHSPDLRKQLNLQPAEEGRCDVGTDNFPNRVGHDANLEVHNYACSGAPGVVTNPHNFQAQVDQAQRDNNLNAGTRLVSILFGMNDSYQEPETKKLPEIRHQEFVDGMSAQIERVRRLAPNARITLVGYPDLTDGQNNLCPVNAFGYATHVYVPGLAYIQDSVRNAQRDVANRTNVPFLDIAAEINVQNNNNSCTNGNRLAAADLDDQKHNLWGHLTESGNQYYADRVRSVL